MAGQISDDPGRWVAVPRDPDRYRRGRHAGPGGGAAGTDLVAHHCAVAWMAAWLKLRGHGFLGRRELLEGDEWSGGISWRDRSGYKNAKHRPDLIACPHDRGHVAIEVELTKKSVERLRAILLLHAVWAGHQTGGVIYVCADEDGCKRITKHAAHVGLAKGRGLRVEQLHTIKAQALAASAEAGGRSMNGGSATTSAQCGPPGALPKRYGVGPYRRS